MLFGSKVLKLLDGKNFASFATVMPNGFPQVTPVWIDYDNDHNLLVNTAMGRIKEKNIDKNTKVALSVFNMYNPYEMVSITGLVTEKLTNDADNHFHKLSKKYLNLDRYPLSTVGEKRLILKIIPKTVFYTLIPLENYIK